MRQREREMEHKLFYRTGWSDIPEPVFVRLGSEIVCRCPKRGCKQVFQTVIQCQDHYLASHPPGHRTMRDRLVSAAWFLMALVVLVSTIGWTINWVSKSDCTKWDYLVSKGLCGLNK